MQKKGEVMDFDVNLLSVSHFLERHPILQENVKYKVKYLNVLEYFTRKYSRNEFANSLLENYKAVFLGGEARNYIYREQQIKKTARGVAGLKFKGFKLFTYRYALVCDTFFINCLTEPAKAQEILDEIKTIFKKGYHQKLQLLFSILYQDNPLTEGLNQVSYQIKAWKLNQKHVKQKPMEILITATMSAGKSTLINALVGKTVTRTMNDACTAKLHYIFDKAYEDGYTYGFDTALSLNADDKILLNDDRSNEDFKKYVGTYFRLFAGTRPRLCIIDTPGINSSLNRDHTDISAQAILDKKYDRVIYVVNAENLGTNDDIKYLEFICKHVKETSLVFVLNKSDRFRTPHDSIEESIQNLREDLKKIGISNPIVLPVSSYAGVLAKKKLFGMDMDEDEEDDYLFLNNKFRKAEYDLSRFYPDNVGKVKKEHELLKNCGLLGLEQILLKGTSSK